MAYHFRNFIFEGGGVKGIAYIGAMEALEEKDILPHIKRVGGTSAGAINAVLLGLGYSLKETKDILWALDFNSFKDDMWFGADILRLVRKYGWHKGNAFRGWIGDIIKEKTGSSETTFAELHATGEYRDLYLVGTNLSTRFSEIFSHEHSPDMPIAEAARISMSIPFFFTAIKRKNTEGQKEYFVDGGVVNNYPVKLFDREIYLEHKANGRLTDYYKPYNKSAGNHHLYNKETLGFRLDSRAEIAVFTGTGKPKHHRIKNLFQFSWGLIDTLLEGQESIHLHSDDWQRTIYIDTLGVKTTEFDISEAKKKALITSGRKGVENYFAWYDKKRAINKPSKRKG